MALMNTLRNKMGKFVVGAVAVAILSFVLTDLLGPNSQILGGQDTTVGEIAGNKIDYQEFQQRVEEQRINFALNTNRNPTERDMVNIREQAWERLFSDLAFGDEYKKLGVQVTREELVDMVQGENIQPELRQAFTDPETGEFDKSRIKSYLADFSNLPEQQQVAWTNFESNLVPGRRRIKYENLLIKTEYVTGAEAIREYHNQSDVAEVKYLYVPFLLVSDSLIDSPDDKELQKYIDDHADQYEVEETRSFQYVTFPIDPSAEDTVFFRDEMNKLKAEFQNIKDDSIFARNNSDNPRNAFQTYSIGELPQPLVDQESLEQGLIIGPFMRNQNLTMYKVSEIFEDSLFSAKARHILIKWEDETPEAKSKARAEAQGLLNEIKGGADFAQMAREHGTDGTAVRGGDLGWFKEGAMVQPFQDAVFGASEAGLINKLVETQFGYHIIDVTNPKTKTNYKIASIEREITPSDKTDNNVYRKSEFFAMDIKDLDTFTAKAKQDTLSIRTSANVDKNARNAGALTDAREIIRWLYQDAELGDVSDVFKLDDQYVVVVFDRMQEKGTNTLANVRSEVALKVKNQRKAELIREKLDDLTGTLDEMANAYGSEASMYTMADLKISSNSLNGVGIAPEAVGVAFSLQAAGRSKPVDVENGVVVMELMNFTEAPEVADYTVYKDQVKQRQSGRAAFNITNAMKEFAEIEDERYKFY